VVAEMNEDISMVKKDRIFYFTWYGTFERNSNSSLYY